MATHYDILGVASDASPDDLRRAYRDLARALHPDRTIGEPTDDARRAAGRMRDVNEAWRVLREPTRRAAYDRSLAAVAGRAATGGPSGPAAGGTAGHPNHAAADLDFDFDLSTLAPRAQPGDLGLSVVRALPWLAVGIVLAAIFVFTAFAGSHRTSDDPGDLVGRCMSTGASSAVVPVPCDAPNDGEVVLVVDRASLCPDGSSGRPVAGDRWLCLEPHGRPPSPSSTVVVP